MKKNNTIIYYSFFLIVFIFSHVHNSFSQNQAIIDSLLNELENEKQDTSKIKLYLKIGKEYQHTIPDTALFYYQKALDISKNITTKKFIAQCSKYIGIIHLYQGSYNKAIEYFLKQLKIAEELGDEKGMSSCYNNIGFVHTKKGSYDKAIEYHHKSLKMDEELGDKLGISNSYNNIGVVHHYQGSYDKAIEYYLKSLIITEKLGDKLRISNSYNNIGVFYEKQGSFAKDPKIRTEKYDKAVEYYLKSLKIREELGDKNGMTKSYHNIGFIHQEQGSFAKDPKIRMDKYDKAIEYYLKSLKIREEMGDKNGIASTNNNIASLNISIADSVALTENQRLNYLNKAVRYGNKSFELAKEIRSTAYRKCCCKCAYESL